ncbi:MAG: phosphosulfolactate synthase [Actinomycetota bacterium]|nr:phosphosulfolactate synthase [Actinomycetota bacterium]
MPDFLPLPQRAGKPRTAGLTHVIDPGLSVVEAEGLLRMAGAHIDTVRLGWGSAYVSGDLDAKLGVYRAHGIPVMLGGTLTELAWRYDRVDELSAWLQRLGIDRVEVSSGVVTIPPREKARLVERLAQRFTVYVEVGEKDPDALMAPYRWVQEIRDGLAAGAAMVVCEGRASGTAGLYRRDGETRAGLIDEIVHEIDPSQLIFEAPQSHQQVWLIERYGTEVNLGNVPPAEVLSVETLRLGLRADTLPRFHRGDRR